MKLETRDQTVVFADITNSTGLFLKLGDIAASALEKEWMAAVRRLVPRFDGVFVKAVGDEAMCAFPSADAGLLAACEIQAMTCSEPFRDHAIRLHVGAHHGRVVVEDGDMYGDTVNVAAYLCTVARAEQIIIAEATWQRLSPALKSYARPVFRTRLKSHPEETILYQVLWKAGDPEVTLNLFAERRDAKPIPAEVGGLLLTCGGRQVRLNYRKNTLTIGRGADCDLVIDKPWVSRRHAKVRLIGSDFYLFDESINATFVTLREDREIEVLRNDFLLEGSGRISPGRSAMENPGGVIEFARDRRSLYRP